MLSAGEVRTFRTPSTGASDDIKRPSGDNFALKNVGLLNSFRRGIRGRADIWSLSYFARDRAMACAPLILFFDLVPERGGGNATPKCLALMGGAASWPKEQPRANWAVCYDLQLTALRYRCQVACPNTGTMTASPRKSGKNSITSTPDTINHTSDIQSRFLAITSN